jgi:hypothetical protein
VLDIAASLKPSRRGEQETTDVDAMASAGPLSPDSFLDQSPSRRIRMASQTGYVRSG